MNNTQKQIKYVKEFAGCKKVLELGSGKGEFLKACKDAGITVTGVDLYGDDKGIIKSDAMKYLKKTKKQSFDGVYARHFVEHFTPENLEKMFKMISAVLKKDGRFIMIFPNLRNINVSTYEFWSDPTHVRPYTPGAIASILEKAGFRLEKHGPDYDNWDNSLLKNIVRKTRAAILGIKSGPPDYYVIAVKKKT